MLLTLEAYNQMFQQAESAVTYLQLSLVLLNRNLQPANKSIIITRYVDISLEDKERPVTFARNLLSIKMFADLISRWI